MTFCKLNHYGVKVISNQLSDKKPFVSFNHFNSNFLLISYAVCQRSLTKQFLKCLRKDLFLPRLY